ncbi:bifunctional DNA primase/polymerase [Pseudonocardia sp. NPDC049635]|uniref:bifunctional DNA primase/polymerase n=1 Tax=Pseudonocardia sp. NPDC049635 TaxID=3155506 RepID=UPI0033F3183E
MASEAQSEPTAGGGSALGRLGRQALRAAAAGMYVFPLQPGTKKPAVPDWENEATRDPGTITRWWAERPFNIGIATRPSRLVVVDLDPRKPDEQEPPEAPYERCKHGLEVLRLLAAAAGEKLPLDTYRVSSPSGGQHWYFRAPDEVEVRNSQRRVAPLIDVRAGGGYIVAATSSRRGGGVYRALNDRPIAALPQWLLAALLAAGPQVPAPSPPVARAAGEAAACGTRRVQAYVKRIVEDELDRLRTVPKGVGKRHKARLDAALKLGSLVGGGHLTREDALDRLLEVALTHVGSSIDQTSGRIRSRTTAHEVRTTVENGLDYGMKRPRVITEADLRDRR